MSMPENWFASCEQCDWRNTSDISEEEIKSMARAHVAEFQTHRCQLLYELWLGIVKHE